jgi:DNA helicase-2/ATP-dependent DNA helicase PcrA
MAPLDWMDAQAAAAESAADEASAAAILEGLNEAQREAVTHGDGPMLILAGAGSGKTRVITCRIAHLVATGRATPHEILAITFTNKAAREMRERVARFLPVKGLWISTFHAMCARMLRREIERLGTWTRDFTIYDTHDRNLLLKTITKDLGYDVQRFRPQLLGSWISDEKTRRFDRDFEGPEEPDGSIESEVFVKVRDRYEREMGENNALDFDDLLIRTLEILQAHPGVRDAYSNRFRHVLVDEYQDTNRIQYLLTRHLSAWHGNLAVCGDPDQSIYGWRGADIKNILDFEEDWGSVRTVKLERNYRSTQCILAGAQGLIRNNVSRKEKDLWSDRESDERIHVLECADENDEANEIAARIHGLREEGVKPDEIAVFYRVNFMQRALERSLRFAGIPYQIVGGVEFYQRREIRDLLAYLHLIVNPKDDLSCRRVVNVPARGVGERSLEKLATWAAERGVPLLAAAGSADARAEIRGRAKAGLAAFAGLMERLADYADRSASMALEAVVSETDYFEWLASSGDQDAASREENVEELRSHAATYDDEEPEGGLRGFLQEIALVSDVDGYDEEGPRVTLMTLHSSKGLEFPVVFVAGLEEELLPHALSMADSSGNGEKGDDGVEEERRLMYVGMTRAQDVLYLTHAKTRLHFGESSWRVPSRFLEEIPADCVESSVHEQEREADLGAYEAPEDAVALAVGDRVEHDHFGYGYVERMQGSGINARVTVDFQSVGTKVLLVQYAKLKVVAR